jgi:hypothetical protein
MQEARDMFRAWFILFIVFAPHALANDIVHTTDWVDSDEMGVILRKMDDNRLFPCDVQGRVEGIEVYYQASYCPFLPEMNYFYSRWGMNDSWYAKWSDYYKEYGMQEHFHTTFLDLGGNTVHQATWIIIGEFKEPKKDSKKDSKKADKSKAKK